MTGRRSGGSSPRSIGRSPHPTQLLLGGLFQRSAGRKPTTREQTADGEPALWANCGEAERLEKAVRWRMKRGAEGRHLGHTSPLTPIRNAQLSKSQALALNQYRHLDAIDDGLEWIYVRLIAQCFVNELANSEKLRRRRYVRVYDCSLVGSALHSRDVRNLCINSPLGQGKEIMFSHRRSDKACEQAPLGIPLAATRLTRPSYGCRIG
jgi:hypothetical protein